MNRRTWFAVAFAIAATVAAVACSSPGKGLNFGCGPDDPCCAKGTWYFNCPGSGACGACTADTPPSSFGPLTISASVARDGGTAFLGDAGRQFDVTSCAIVRPPSGLCSTPAAYYFGSNGPTFQSPVACVDTTANTCLAVCNNEICTPQLQ